MLLVVLDTVRADHLSVYGYPRATSPFLEEFGREATVYELAISPGVWTVPAHVSIFTGRSVRQHKANWGNRWLSDELATLAELLHGHGYRTISFSNNVHPSETNLLQGFEERYPMWWISELSRTCLYDLHRWLGIAPVAHWMERDDGAALTNWCVADWLDSRRQDDRPFFAFVNYMEAHVLYWPPQEYRRLFMDGASVERSYHLLAEHRDLHTLITRNMNFCGPDVLSPRDQAILRDLYDAAIRYLDDRLRELCQALQQRGLLEDTVLVITSDHGESLGEHGYWEHQWSVYDTLVHVPLIIRYPPAFSPIRVSDPVSTADLFATIVELCGLSYEPEPGQRWVNLAAESITGPDMGVVSEYLAPYHAALRWAEKHVVNFDKMAFQRTFRSIVANREKLIVACDGTAELYDLEEDPGEMRPLTERRPESYKALSTLLENWLERTPEYTVSGEADSPPTEISWEARRALESLGYVGGG